jgi:hypothetical protein
VLVAVLAVVMVQMVVQEAQVVEEAQPLQQVVLELLIKDFLAFQQLVLEVEEEAVQDKQEMLELQTKAELVEMVLHLQ